MRSITLCLAAAACLAPVAALANNQPPPARYDHVYAGPKIVTRVPNETMTSACRLMVARFGVSAPAYQVQGCSVLRWDNVCEIILPIRPYPGVTPKDILRHEMGHCNGWPSNHPAQ